MIDRRFGAARDSPLPQDAAGGSDPCWFGEAKYQALLAVSEAVNRRLELPGVLDAVAKALDGLVPVDGVGLLARDGPGIRPVAFRRYGQSSRGEQSEADLRRLVGHGKLDGGQPDALLLKLERGDRTVVVGGPPLPQHAAVRPLDGGLCVLVRLATDERFVGGLAFARTAPVPFSPREVGILEDISRPVASAVANALAFEEIHALRTRLEEENQALQEEIELSVASAGIIGAATGLRGVMDRVARVAATDTTVLITGETGTGKELVARAIHRASSRAARAMVKVNCAAFAEGLVASELFGHEKGAFTGAVERRRGRFELAARGTIFLDEVGELPHAVQVGLLRVLQEGEFERVGGSQPIRTDARVVAATNRDLERAILEGHFRSDLFFRLNVFPIRMPALRERPEDVPLLAEHYVHHYSRKLGKPILDLSGEAMAALRGYGWPGNVRELQNVVERAVILARGPRLDYADLELPSMDRPDPLPKEERRAIEDALLASEGRVSGARGAAAALGMPPSTLESRIQRLGIDKLAFRRVARRGR